MDAEDEEAAVLALQAASDLKQNAGRIIVTLARVIAGEIDPTMAVIDELRTATAALRTQQETLTTSIQLLAQRLADNSQPADIEAVSAELNELASNLGGNTAAIDALDPEDLRLVRRRRRCR